MPWAIHAAELRLWLQLIVETEFKKEELRKHPLLPNLNLNLRIGDSLVQEIGGISFNIRTNDLKPHLKKKLENLKYEKRKYFINDPTAKFKTPEEVRAEEIRLFEEIIDERIEGLKKDIESLENDMKKRGKQVGLFSSEINVEAEVYLKEKEKINAIKKEIESIEKEIEKLKRIKELLKDPEKKPFVWDIDFAEVFSDKGGFDVVIGNPPYVRYQKISPPNKLKAEITSLEKKEYKEKLVRSIQTIFPIIQKVDKKSDYYLYFYFHGLGLLNEKGTFCFITSNSWLDVEYGKSLQEFVLKYVPVYAIYDNSAKKSFAHADVNTIIALFGAPRFVEEITIAGLKVSGNENNWPMLNHIAKFVMFKKPFEEVINSKNLKIIENANTLIKNEDFRVYPISQKELYDTGLNDKGVYRGTMWGGRYLRSPDIFLDIENKCSNKLERLNKVINVETYLNTLGSDNFFFVSVLKNKGKIRTIQSRIENKKFDIEKEFIVDFIETPKELKSIVVKGKFKTKLFRIPPNKNTSEIKKTKAYEYIKFGKRKGFKTSLPKQAYNGGKIIIACYQGASHIIYYNPQEIISHRFFRLHPKDKKIDIKQLVLLLNSTFNSLSLEIFRNPSLGGGVLAHGTYTIGEFLVINPQKIKIDTEKFDSFLNREIKPIFEELGLDPSKPIREQEPKPLPDRAELDKIIFDELGLTEEERKEVYWAVAELVKQRLEKARSLRR